MFEGTAWRGALSGYVTFFAILTIAGDSTPNYTLMQLWLLAMAFSVAGVIIELLLREPPLEDNQDEPDDE